MRMNQKKREWRKISEYSLYQRGLGHDFFFWMFLLEELFVSGHPPDVNGGQNGPCDQDANDDADSAQGKRPKKTDESRRGVPTLSGGGVSKVCTLGVFGLLKVPTFLPPFLAGAWKGAMNGAGGYLKSLL